MQKITQKRLTSLALCAAMTFACCVPAFAADKSDANASGSDAKSDNALVELSGTLNLSSYAEYLEKHAGTPAGTDEIVIKAVDYDKANTTSEVSVESGVYGSSGEVLDIDELGRVTWSFNVEKAGMYSLKFKYAPKNDKKTNIERVFYINGEVPYSEARYINFQKVWKFEYTEQEDGSMRFAKDTTGSEVRPDSYCDFSWNEIVFNDVNTYYQAPLTFYFREGVNTITLESSRDSFYLDEITLFHAGEAKSYEDVVKEYAEKGYTAGNAVIHLDAETPDATSNYTVYPDYDRSSAITEPQDPLLIMRNVIGGDNWQQTSDWVRYTFTVPEGGAGLYSIVLRFKQDISDGVFTSRAVKIDGSLPYAEANNCRFGYGSEWQVSAVGDGQHQFVFYLDEGEHTLELMATLGEFSQILTKIKTITNTLNGYYTKIMSLTGTSPDTYRDYGFARIMPDVVAGFTTQAEELRAILEYVSEITGSYTSSNAAIENMITVLDKMASDESEIAANFSAFRDAVSNLSSWVANNEVQPLTVDYIQIQSPEAELPKAEASMIESLKYEFSMFIGSFYTDYNALAPKTEEEQADYDVTLQCWTSSGRDQAQIMRNLVDGGFCQKYGIGVTVKLVDGGALLPSILAGVGPDVSLDATNPIDYALRGACAPFNQFSDFEEVIKNYNPAAVNTLSLFGNTYAIPYAMTYKMMFVRTDVLADLGLATPKTWDELLSMVPVLQYNNMDVGIPNDYQVFLYQREGGDIWDETSENVLEHGWKTTFEENLTLSAFEDMCNMFTQYSLPVSYNAETRFKDGSMPIIVSDSSFYTTVTVSAPELAGLWEMYPIPGTEDEEGNINNNAVVASSGIMLLRGCRDTDAAWRFIKWYTSKNYQVDFVNEMIALLGESAKVISANVEAMPEMPWSTKEFTALKEQSEHLVGIPSYPGSYIIARYTSFAFSDAYNNGADPVNSLLGYVNSINAEITRKRTEFGYPLYSVNSESSEE